MEQAPAMLTGRIWLFPQGMLTLRFSPRPVGNMEGAGKSPRVALPPPLPWGGGWPLVSSSHRKPHLVIAWRGISG